MKKKINTKPKLKIRTGDLVQVISGDSKGKRGKILKVLLEKNRAFVEGANIVSKHVKPGAANPNGGIVKQEAAIHISNLMLVDVRTGNLTRVGRVKSSDGKLVRIAKKSGEEVE